MKTRFLILLFSAFFALAFSDRTESKECREFIPNHEVVTIEEEFSQDDAPLSEYGIPRQNTYSSPTRTLHTAKRTTTTTGGCKIKYATKSCKHQDTNSFFHTLAFCVCDYSGINSPLRLLISLRKLII